MEMEEELAQMVIETLNRMNIMICRQLVSKRLKVLVKRMKDENHI